MRTARLLLPLLFIGAAAPVFAQDFATHVVKTPKVHLGGSFIVAEPQQDFRDYVNTSFGGSLHMLWMPNPAGLLGLRVEGGAIGYGHEHKEVRLSRITLDLSTSNVISFLHAGPQLTLRAGPVRPYVAPSIGFAYIATMSSVSGDNSESFASDTHYDDFLFSYGVTGGVLIPVTRGKVPISIDLSTRYHQNGKASYLVEGSIRDLPDGIAFDPIRSNANLLSFQIGVSVGIVVDPKKKGDENDD